MCRILSPLCIFIHIHCYFCLLPLVMICHHGTHFLQLMRPILKIQNDFNHLKQERNLVFKKDLRERWKIQWNVRNRSPAGAPSYTSDFNIAELLERVKVPVTLALEFINEIHQRSCFQKPQYIVRLFWYQLSIYINTEFFHPSCPPFLSPHYPSNVIGAEQK